MSIASPSSRIWDLVSNKKALPFLKEFTYKMPDFNLAGAKNISSLDIYKLFSGGSETEPIGTYTPGAVPDSKKYYGWSPDESLEFQRRYGEMTNQQAAEAWRDIYEPGILASKQKDLQLQLAGDIYSPTRAANRNLLAAQSGLTAAQNFAAGAGAEAGLSTALGYQLQAAKQPARIGYTGQTFTA